MLMSHAQSGSHIWTCNILNNFFTEQTLLDESQASLPQRMTTPIYKLDSLSITPEEVEQTLK